MFGGRKKTTEERINSRDFNPSLKSNSIHSFSVFSPHLFFVLRQKQLTNTANLSHKANFRDCSADILHLNTVVIMIKRGREPVLCPFVYSLQKRGGKVIY